jgi:shikimate dehydrogenase
MRVFGLIGHPLGHSFSQRYFTEKFRREGLADCRYELFDMPDIVAFPGLLAREPELCGLNVTIPHKRAVIPYIDALTPEAEAVGAVNCILFRQGRTIGHNTDIAGFETSLRAFMGEQLHRPGLRALILGRGGAALAAAHVLARLGIPNETTGRADFPLSADRLTAPLLLVNATPLGMHPHPDTAPDLPYTALGPEHWVFDMVYNPETTRFMQLAAEQRAQVCNGLAMLYAQAEENWRVW